MTGMVPSMRSFPRIIIFAGPDGAGKTTLAQWLAAALRERGYPCRYVWLRFSHLFSLPLLAYGRLTGLTRLVRIGDRTHKMWEFHRSPLVSWLFPWTAMADVFLGGLWRLRLPAMRGQVLVCDRYASDVLVDVMLATGNMHLGDHLAGRLILRAAPSQSITFVINASPEVIRQRRPELVGDTYLEQKCSLYRAITSQAGGINIENDGSIDEAIRQINEHLVDWS
jgi:thymidylate kinase